MPMMTIHDQSIFYAHHMNGESGPTLVLIHGAGGSHLDWPGELRRLPGTAVYAPDLPGHGRSTPPGRSTIEDYADDVLNLLEALQLENVVLVGHSMGGAVVQMVGLHHSPRVVGLVLVGTGARLRVTEAILGKALTEMETAVSTIVSFYWSGQVPEEIKSLSHKNLLHNDPAVLLGDFTACHHFDLRDQLSQIAHPTLVISAADDQMTPPKYGRFLADHIPHAQFALIEKAAHMMMLEQPGAVAAAIQQFIHRL